MRYLDSALEGSQQPFNSQTNLLQQKAQGSATAAEYKSYGKDEVFNYPYLCDEANAEQAREELQFADKIKSFNQNNSNFANLSGGPNSANATLKKPSSILKQTSNYPSNQQQAKSSGFSSGNGRGGALIQKDKQFDQKSALVQAFIDMMQTEGNFEKKKRELSLRSDFNLTDAFKMFNSVKNHRRGIDVDDLYYVLLEYLGLKLTKDEVFILFYKLDRDGDGFISYTEMSRAFVPH